MDELIVVRVKQIMDVHRVLLARFNLAKTDDWHLTQNTARATGISAKAIHQFRRNRTCLSNENLGILSDFSSNHIPHFCLHDNLLDKRSADACAIEKKREELRISQYQAACDANISLYDWLRIELGFSGAVDKERKVALMKTALGVENVLEQNVNQKWFILDHGNATQTPIIAFNNTAHVATIANRDEGEAAPIILNKNKSSFSISTTDNKEKIISYKILTGDEYFDKIAKQLEYESNAEIKKHASKHKLNSRDIRLFFYALYVHSKYRNCDIVREVNISREVLINMRLKPALRSYALSKRLVEVLTNKKTWRRHFERYYALALKEAMQKHARKYGLRLDSVAVRLCASRIYYGCTKSQLAITLNRSYFYVAQIENGLKKNVSDELYSQILMSMRELDKK